MVPADPWRQARGPLLTQRSAGSVRAQDGATVRLRAMAERGRLAPNDDGTTSFISIDPTVEGFEFVVAERDGKNTLIIATPSTNMCLSRRRPGKRLLDGGQLRALTRNVSWSPFDCRCRGQSRHVRMV